MDQEKMRAIARGEVQVIATDQERAEFGAAVREDQVRISGPLGRWWEGSATRKAEEYASAVIESAVSYGHLIDAEVQRLIEDVGAGWEPTVEELHVLDGEVDSAVGYLNEHVAEGLVFAEDDGLDLTFADGYAACARCKTVRELDDLDTDFGLCDSCRAYNESRVVL